MEQPSGNRVVVRVNIDPLRDPSGRRLGAINVFEDITEHRRAEEATTRLAAIVEFSEDAIISKDLNGIITSWNRGAERVFGYSSQEAVGEPITMLIPADRLSEEPDILKRIRRGDSVEHYETLRRHKDGTLRHISLSVSPLRDERGIIVGASKIARDITERKRVEKVVGDAQAQLQRHAINLEKMVAERTADLQATNQQLEAFVYSIAHDLRAPLRSMEGYSAMLVEAVGTSLGEMAQRYTERINRSAQFMDQLLTDLLAFSQISQQRMELASVPLGRVLEGALARLEEEIQERQVQVFCEGPWPFVRAHAPTLGQILYNLISNALKFMAPGVQPVLRIRAELRGESGAAEPGHVRVWVEDNGIGIAPEYLNQIFRLFTRLEGGKYSGTGIGLAIVQKGVERMNGRVGVESTLGRGSRFWIELEQA
jgi:PAS domain S-box-containing protein